MAALVIGAIMVLIGALLFLEPTPLQDIEDLLLMYLGLILMPIGAGLVFLAARTLSAAPDQLYQPQSSAVPRNLFVVFWLVGVIVPLVLHVEAIQRTQDLQPGGAGDRFGVCAERRPLGVSLV